MKFPTPVQKGQLVKRYKRFLADITLQTSTQTITAHCANPGSMRTVNEEGAVVWVTKAQNPNRKLQYDWQVIKIQKALICINTALANTIVAEAIAAGQIEALIGYDKLEREIKYGHNSRIDIRLSATDKPDCYVEVKNVTLSRQTGLAEFPDSTTARGTKHLMELADMARQGHRAVMFYLVNRTDSTDFTLAHDIDPSYAATFDKARQAGLDILIYRTHIDETGITIGPQLKYKNVL